MPDDKYQALVEMNNKYQTTKESLFRSYPCIEFKSQLKDGQIQITEIAYSEKYLTEMGHTTETFTSTVFEEGLPPLIPIDSHGTRTIAKLRLEKYLGTQDGFQTPEFESVLLMRHGYTKNVKMRIYYNAFYEKGVPGFSFINMIVANQKSTLKKIQAPLGIGLNQGFVEHMIKREKETADFASKYYDEKVEQKYTNMDKVCQVRELKDEDSL